jgi:hypothetical protein
MNDCFTSVGVLRYSRDYKLIVEADPGIVETYRALVPKWVRLNRQRYAPHISVVRRETPLAFERWGLHEGKTVEFEYRGVIANDDTYYWLGVFSERLHEVRIELGLPPKSWITEAPDASSPFHITIGNVKNV